MVGTKRSKRQRNALVGGGAGWGGREALSFFVFYDGDGIVKKTKKPNRKVKKLRTETVHSSERTHNTQKHTVTEKEPVVTARIARHRHTSTLTCMRFTIRHSRMDGCAPCENIKQTKGEKQINTGIYMKVGGGGGGSGAPGRRWKGIAARVCVCVCVCARACVFAQRQEKIKQRQKRKKERKRKLEVESSAFSPPPHAVTHTKCEKEEEKCQKKSTQWDGKISPRQKLNKKGDA